MRKRLSERAWERKSGGEETKERVKKLLEKREQREENKEFRSWDAGMHSISGWIQLLGSINRIIQESAFESFSRSELKKTAERKVMVVHVCVVRCSCRWRACLTFCSGLGSVESRLPVVGWLSEELMEKRDRQTNMSTLLSLFLSPFRATLCDNTQRSELESLNYWHYSGSILFFCLFSSLVPRGQMLSSGSGEAQASGCGCRA